MIILKPFSFVLYLCSWSIEHKWRTSYCSLLKIYLVTNLNILASQRFWWSWFSSVQFSRSVVSDSLRPHELQHTRPPCPSPTPGFHPNPCPSSRWCLQPSHPLSSPSPPALNLSQHQVFSNESAFCIRWPKYWSFSFNVSPSNEQPGLISFRIDWLDLLAVQGTLKSLLQHHTFLALSFLYNPTLTSIHDHWKTIALTRQTFIGKVKSLLFNMLSSLVITFLPRSKRLLISLLQSPSAVILEPRKINSAPVSTVSPSICHVSI